MRSPRRWLAALVTLGLLVVPLLFGACNEKTKKTKGDGAVAATEVPIPVVPAPAVPSPAARRRVLVEVDQMVGTPVLQTERTIGGAQVSLKSIYADAGLDLDVRADQTDLPRKDGVSLADLHAMMLAFRSLPVPEGSIRIHVLVVTRELDDPDTLGVMFDFGDEDNDGFPREGFAIMADPHGDLGPDVADEMLLTAAHELAHCFNLHHADWEGNSFKSGSTIEGYSLADTAIWKLSKGSKIHLSADPFPEIWPGDGSLAFGLVTASHAQRHQKTPNESFDIVEPSSIAAARRGSPHVHPDAAANLRGRSRFHTPDSYPLKLRLEAPKRSYQIGEPVVLTVGLHNESTQPMPVVPLLGPEHRFLAIELRRPGSDRFEPFLPGVVTDKRGAKVEMLPPGGSLHAEARIFFGSEGWIFGQPGTWVVRADFPAGAGDGTGAEAAAERIQATPVEIEIVEPRTPAELRAKELVFGQQQGIYLLLGGGDHLKKARARLGELVDQVPTAAQAPAARLALGTAALHPTVDISTKVESPPRLDEAKRLLQTTLEGSLPSLSVANAQAALAQQLEKAGKVDDANQVRINATQKLSGKESAKKALEKLQVHH